MPHFIYNRYNPEKLIEEFNKARIHMYEDCCTIKLESFDDYEIEIYFPLFEKNIPEELKDKAREVLKDINITDNIVQRSCEEASKKSKSHVRNYLIELA